MKVARILGVPFSTKGFRETISDLAARIQKGERTHVVTANPEIVMIANENESFKAIVEQAYVVPDGIGIVYAAKWTHQPITERVTGFELLEALMEEANQRAWSVYLLGASPETNQKAAGEMEKRYPNATIAGRRDGFFDQKEASEIAEDIAQKKPELLFVAMGAPKQDEWIATHWDILQVPLVMGVGGSFDVLAGHVKRAPVFWQKLHLEWFYRLMKQPSRWRRQLAIPRFVYAVLWGRLKNRS